MSSEAIPSIVPPGAPCGYRQPCPAIEVQETLINLAGTGGIDLGLVDAARADATTACQNCPARPQFDRKRSSEQIGKSSYQLAREALGLQENDKIPEGRSLMRNGNRFVVKSTDGLHWCVDNDLAQKGKGGKQVHLHPTSTSRIEQVSDEKYHLPLRVSVREADGRWDVVCDPHNGGTKKEAEAFAQAVRNNAKRMLSLFRLVAGLQQRFTEGVTWTEMGSDAIVICSVDDIGAMNLRAQRRRA